MAETRVFISHKNGDQNADLFLDQLVEQLDLGQFDALVDFKQLEAGQEWRDEIYSWVGLCHATVILLSPAALESVWVSREASLLLWRRTLEPGFLVIPVLCGGLLPEQCNTGLFEDLHLHQIESLQLDAVNSEEILNKVIDRLKVARVEPSTPLEKNADIVASCLSGVDDPVIVEAVKLLQCDLGPWNPDRNIKRALGLQLLQTGVSNAAESLEYLSQHVSPDKVLRILDLIAPSWVDLCAARWVAENALKQSEVYSVINASSMFAAEAYVNRASGQSSSNRYWPAIPFTGIYGEDAPSDIVGEMQQALGRKLNLVSDPLEAHGQSIKRLHALLKTRKQKGKPVFMILEYRAEISGVLDRLQDAFPDVSFILLSGDQFPEIPPTISSPVREVKPELKPGAEEQAQNDYDFARSNIDVG